MSSIKHSFVFMFSVLALLVGVFLSAGTPGAQAQSRSAPLSAPLSATVDSADERSKKAKKVAAKKKAAKKAAKAKRVAAKKAKKAKKRSKTIVRTAKKYVGVKYRYGGTTPRSGFDCSGFTQFVYKKATGKKLPRSSSEQRHAGKRVKSPRPGDLVWSPGHISIYVSKGKIIDAPKPGKTVRVRAAWQPSPVFIRP